MAAQVIVKEVGLIAFAEFIKVSAKHLKVVITKDFWATVNTVKELKSLNTWGAIKYCFVKKMESDQGYADLVRRAQRYRDLKAMKENDNLFGNCSFAV